MASPARLRLFRTTAFRLSAIFLAVFSIFSTLMIGYIVKSTMELLEGQTLEAVGRELDELAAQYQLGGIVRLARVVDLRSQQPGASLYLIADPDGAKVAGNVAFVPSAILDNPRPEPQTVPYRGAEETGGFGRRVALVRVFELPAGYRLLVGRDVSERNQLIEITIRALLVTMGLMVVLGLASWLFVSHRVLKRIDSMAATSRRIIAGDLTGRLEVTGTGDEFDRLAESLNTMLERIERLMEGLKEVSDNIAHDLKTPLTRMRTRVEAVLSGARDEHEYRDALQATIDDADQLIRTFDALLMIARAEAGSSGTAFSTVDVTSVAEDVFELYEPLSEEAGAELTFTANGPAPVAGIRELLAQALANLVDNALKYAEEGAEKPRVTISVEREADVVRLAVADNGPGIPPEDRARATERFVRLEKSRSKPGAGLGLSLVAAVARLHHGALSLEANGPGLRAVLILPAAKEIANAA
ncbi:ATP-binding protein [Propylenella binzhouense]|uniref:histidine kinase n=1 Tax=Propylenella binzhouense TaxID=2555902 RepID=A0A964WUB2_9HYPH|nr:ATP-binding protein [Propylenella binzhouense]MYZ48876.1 HAMP domain-containing protein [Propylenella binzhouense]